MAKPEGDTMQDSPITATVDFHRDGVQHGFLKLPHSHDAVSYTHLRAHET